MSAVATTPSNERDHRIHHRFNTLSSSACRIAPPFKQKVPRDRCENAGHVGSRLRHTQILLLTARLDTALVEGDDPWTWHAVATSCRAGTGACQARSAKTSASSCRSWLICPVTVAITVSSWAIPDSITLGYCWRGASIARLRAHRYQCIPRTGPRSPGCPPSYLRALWPDRATTRRRCNRSSLGGRSWRPAGRGMR